MTLASTEWFYFVENDQITSGPELRSHLPYGENDTDADMVARGWWRQWYDDGGSSPGKYYRKVVGTVTPNPVATPPRVERADSWESWSEQEIRDSKKEQMDAQVPRAGVLEEVRDFTVRGQIEQAELQRKTAVEELARIPSGSNVRDFDTDIRKRAIAEGEYAANLVAQETRNLNKHVEMVNSGNGGIYTAAEETEIRARVKNNAEVARGEKGGVQEPGVGAQRADVALEGEVRAEASFYEVQFDWSGQTYRIPRAVLREIPAGVNVSLLFGMVYDANNTYLAWLPFEQQPDGSWQTPANEQRIPPARIAEGNWRMAISYGHQSSEYEITRRVHIIPPASAWSWVRWGGRSNPL